MASVGDYQGHLMTEVGNQCVQYKSRPNMIVWTLQTAASCLIWVAGAAESADGALSSTIGLSLVSTLLVGCLGYLMATQR